MEIPIKALENVPHWRGAQIERLPGGRMNACLKVTKGDRVGVLKVDDGPRGVGLNTRSKEAHIQNTAARNGLAAPVILADDGIYLAEYLHGVVLTAHSLSSDELLQRVAQALKRLHALPLTGRSFDAREAADRYVKDSDGLDSATVAKCLEIIDGLRLPQNLCCSHNDLVAENIIAMPDIMFLDWEYACDNDPFFDLATIAEHHQLSDEQVMCLLDTYFDGEGARWLRNIERQRKLYLALLCLWLASRPDTDRDELDRAVARLMLLAD